MHIGNTYLKEYLLPLGYVDAYEILIRDDYYEGKGDMYAEIEHVDFHNIKNTGMENALYISERVYLNTTAHEREQIDFDHGAKYGRYDYTYTRLVDNLKKEAERDWANLPKFL